MRKLATIQTIKELIPIEGADFIELARVMEWRAVVKKGEFAVGDRCVYCEIDSFLPIEERYEFLRKNSYRKNEYLNPTEGFRIKTQKLRGEISQGLILNKEIVPEIDFSLPDGTDVTEVLRIQKWEMPEIESSCGISIGDKPFGIPTTDETRIQSKAEYIDFLKGKPYYITTKMDGTSTTAYYKDGEVGVTGHHLNYKETDDCSYWNLIKQYDLINKLKNLKLNIAIQGEFCGHGIQKNRLKLMTPKFYVFDIYDLDSSRYYTYDELVSMVNKLELDMVPVEETGNSFNYTVEDLLLKAKGKYPSGLDKEGIVVRALDNAYCPSLHERVSFKVLNNDFLSKEKN